MRSDKTDPVISQKSECTKGGKSNRTAYKRKIHRQIDVALIDAKGLAKHVGNTIRCIRNVRGWTQTELAMHTKILTLNQVGRYERGEAKGMSDLLVIADTLGVSVQMLFPAICEEANEDDLEVDSQNLKEVLIQYRKQKGYSRGDVAECLEVDVDTYRDWERHGTDNYVHIYHLLQVMGLSMARLYSQNGLTERITITRGNTTIDVHISPR